MVYKPWQQHPSKGQGQDRTGKTSSQGKCKALSIFSPGHSWIYDSDLIPQWASALLLCPFPGKIPVNEGQKASKSPGRVD